MIDKFSWCIKLCGTDRSPKVLAFLADLDKLQQRYDLSLDGAFEVEHGYGESWVDGALELIYPVPEGGSK